MISEEELNRIKDYLLTEDLVDNKIGIGLGLNKGMSFTELSELILDEEIKKVVLRRKEELSIQLGVDILDDYNVPDDFKSEYLKYLTTQIEEIHQTEMIPPKKKLIR